MAQHAGQAPGDVAEGPDESRPARPNYRRDNRRSLYHPASAADGNGAPEVYWSEGVTPSGTGSHAQGQPFTFLREPTPEPDARRGDKRRASVGGAYFDDDETDDGDVREGVKRRMICGVRPVQFWGIIAVALVILVGVAVGVGVGVGTRKSTPAASGAAPSTTSTSSSAPAPSASDDLGITSSDPTTASSPDPSSAAATTTSRDPAYPTQTSSGSLGCPAANYTLYAVPGSPIRFLRYCDVDMGAGDPSADIRSVRTESMAECMRNCAGTAACAGAGWGPLGDGAAREYWCWLKSREAIDAGFADLPGWEFAVIQ